MESNECCKTCKHLRHLWWWKNYPYDKQDGYCCDLFNTKEDGYTLMQLYSIKDMCEVYVRNDENDISSAIK